MTEGEGKFNPDARADRGISPEHLAKIIEKAKGVGVALTESGNWWANQASHGGILLNGPEVWGQQQSGDTPGLELRFDEETDGGASWVPAETSE